MRGLGWLQKETGNFNSPRYIKTELAAWEALVAAGASCNHKVRRAESKKQLCTYVPISLFSFLPSSGTMRHKLRNIHELVASSSMGLYLSVKTDKLTWEVKATISKQFD